MPKSSTFPGPPDGAFAECQPRRPHWYRAGSTRALSGTHLYRVFIVVVNGRLAAIVSRSSTQVTVRLPAVCASGVYPVSVRACGTTLPAQSVHISATSSKVTVEDSVKVGPVDTAHVQGIAVNERRGYVYCSTTTELIQTCTAMSSAPWQG